jgi:isocitrate dehydrogenase kinase/phosphatase
MKSKKKKIFDAVQMVREIRDAMFKQSTDPNFDKKNFLRIKKKWEKLLEEQNKNTLAESFHH